MNHSYNSQLYDLYYFPNCLFLLVVTNELESLFSYYPKYFRSSIHGLDIIICISVELKT
jgi:hypothetical protein